MAAGQDDALEVAILGIVANPVLADVAGMNFTENMGFANPAGNQLSDLRAEIENKDFLVLHEGRLRRFVQSKKERAPATRRPGCAIKLNQRGSSALPW
jgi:hypothetical protein